MRITLKAFFSVLPICLPAHAQDNTVIVQTARGVMEFTVRPDGLTDTGKGFMVSAQDANTGIIIYDPQAFSETLQHFEKSADYNSQGVAKIDEALVCNDGCKFLGGAVTSADNNLSASVSGMATVSSQPPLVIVVPGFTSTSTLAPFSTTVPNPGEDTPPDKKPLCVVDLNICKQDNPPDFCEC